MMAPFIGENESFKDHTLSWTLFFQNYRAFIATELFAIIAFLITIISALIFMTVFTLIFPENLTFEFIVLLLTFFVILGFNFLFYGFLSCQYGLSHDIMSSGDLFTEFKNSIFYFRRYWWQYSLVTFLIFFPTIFSPVNTLFLNTIRVQGIEFIIGPFTPLMVVIYFLIEYAWIVTFIEIFPGITSHGSLFKSSKENFTILKGNLSRLFLSIGLYYLIFKIPIFILYIISLISPWNQISLLVDVINVINSLYVLISSLLGPPILSLIATRIYVSLKLGETKI